MSRKSRLQIIGNYLENIVAPLEEKGLIVENTIRGLNPLAMSGKPSGKYMHFSNEINNDAVALNIKKNLRQMLSHNKENFCSNKLVVDRGEEVRYRNSTEYVIICNAYILADVFVCDGTLFSNMWPQNDLIKAVLSDESTQKTNPLFSDAFNWKYYYDYFINDILSEYDNDHIILVRMSCSRWYMNEDEIEEFSERSKKFKSAIQKVDDYFAERTHCHIVNDAFSHIPPQIIQGVFPCAHLSKSASKRIADSIFKIVSGEKSSKGFNKYHNDTVKRIVSRLSAEKAEQFREELQTLEDEWVISLDDVLEKHKDESDFFRVLEDLRYFLGAGNINYLYEYLLSGYSKDVPAKDKTKIILDYIEYFKIDISDIISLYCFYQKCLDKTDFGEIVEKLLQKNDFGPIKAAKALYEKNLETLKNYEYLAEPLKKAKADAVYIEIGNSNYLALEALSDEPIKKIKFERAASIEIPEITGNNYFCNISQAESICASWKMYIEKGKNGDGAKPFVISFSSEKEFADSLWFVDYSELLENETFALILNDNPVPSECRAAVDLSFLFRDNVKIFTIKSGLSDQIGYYIASERIGAATNSEIYYDDTIYFSKKIFNGLEVNRFTKKNIDSKLFTHILSKKLLSACLKKQLPDILYENGVYSLGAFVNTSQKWNSFGSCPRMLCNLNTNNLSTLLNNSFNYSPGYFNFLLRPDQFMAVDQPFSLNDYFEFPEYQTDEEKECCEKITSCDAVAIHIRRGDFASWGLSMEDCMGYYFESVQKIYDIPEYTNRKWFVFSDEIPWCIENAAKIGLDQVGGEEVVYVDFNKQENSFRDMQLMALSKVIIGGNSGFSHMAALIDENCEIYLCNNPHINKMYEGSGRSNKYDVGEYTQSYKKNWGQAKYNLDKNFKPNEISTEEPVEPINYVTGTFPDREHVEWLNFWFDKGNEERTDRILLLGDSVARDYRTPLALLTNRPVDFFATSSSLHHEMFWKTLEMFFSFKEYRQTKAQIQIGVHGINGVAEAEHSNDLTEWENDYERLVKTVMEYIPDLTIALTTPVVKPGALSFLDEPINNEIIKRNKAAEKIAEKYNLKVNDLYGLMLNYPHRDWVRFPKDGSERIARKTAEIMGLIEPEVKE